LAASRVPFVPFPISGFYPTNRFLPFAPFPISKTGA
jgi:hypothetical protein